MEVTTAKGITHCMPKPFVVESAVTSDNKTSDVTVSMIVRGGMTGIMTARPS